MHDQLVVEPNAADAVTVVVLELALPDPAGPVLLRTLQQAGAACAVIVISREGGLAAAPAAAPAAFDARAGTPDAGPRAGLTIDDEARCVRRDGAEVRLRPKEYALLRALWARRGQVLTRGELLRTVWGYAEGTATRTVDAHVAALRRKLEPEPGAPRFLLTVTGAGYRLVA